MLHREPPEVGLVERLSGSFSWWGELSVPSIESGTAFSDYLLGTNTLHAKL